MICMLWLYDLYATVVGFVCYGCIICMLSLYKNTWSNDCMFCKLWLYDLYAMVV